MIDMLRRIRVKISAANIWKTSYRTKVFSCIVLAELAFICLFELWPKTVRHKEAEVITLNQAPITMSDIQITRQDNAPPAPGQPKIQPVMPQNYVINENLPELNNLNFGNLSKLPEIGNGSGSGNGIYSHPENPPSVVKIVEPAVPDQAHRAGIKAELTVRFLVNKAGIVKNVDIVSIKKYAPDMKSYQMVQTIGYGIVDATIKAALQWRFRPAIDHGKPVRAYSTHIFTFGL